MAIVIALGGAVIWWFGRRATPVTLPAHSRVLLADFANTTPDTALSSALRQALEAQLAQTPFFTLVSAQTMTTGESQLELPAGTPVRGAAALHLCLRTGSAALVEGSIAQIGFGYSLTLQALNCASGTRIASVQETAADQGQILSALGQATTALRGRLGESLASLSQFDTPIVGVTTSSLPALQDFSRGVEQLTQANYPTALSLFTSALHLDANFAMAYAMRGTAETESGVGDAGQDFTQAYQRREHVSQLERFYITSHYDFDVRGDIPQSESDFRAWAATYPANPIPLVDLGQLELSAGQVQTALADSAAAVRLSRNLHSVANLLLAQVYSGQISAARSLMRRILRQNPNNVRSHNLAQWLAFAGHDEAAMQVQGQWLEQHGDTHSSQDLRNLESLTQAKLRSLQAALASGRDALGLETLAAAYAVMGSHAAARREVAAGLRLSSAATLLGPAALALAISDSPTRAETLETKLEQSAPTSTIVQDMQLPVNRAWVAMARHQPRAALTLLEPALAYERGAAYGTAIAYTHGMVLVALQQYAQAAAEFARVLASPPPLKSDLCGAFATPSRLELARVQVHLGQAAAARANYDKVLAAWKQADRLPLVLAARREANHLR